jgi:hypothetical protein
MKNYLLVFFVLSSSCSIQHSNPYNRKDWPHWSDFDKNCLNTRAEILKERSLLPVKFNKKGCGVKAGKWEDYYYPEIHLKAKNVDVDHLIPLKHAHESGGGVWSREKKEKFANDPDNLVITNRTYNRQKGAKTIAQWLPVQKDYACKYIKDWFKIKKKYGLEIKSDEIDSAESTKCH